jgi:NTP pyrophosphatase (non-canonical NTP hydrolase)
MNFSEYQTQARVTALYPNAGDDFIYPTLGLVGEAGEFANKIKKLMRDQQVFKPSEVSAETKQEVLKELGDVLWYVSCIASEFDVELNDVAQYNLDKLRSRQERGTLNGDGDNR